MRRLPLVHKDIKQGSPEPVNMQRIVVLNPKGGSGKTTIAVNLASYYAQRGDYPVLIDYDPQGSSTRWVRRRQPTQRPIHLITAFERDHRTTRAFQMRIPEQSTHVIIDTPAAVDPRSMTELTQAADKILVPVMPSEIDIHACSRCIANLLLVAKVRRDGNRLAIVANRVKRNTLSYQSLIRFLTTLDIPIIATIRDSQNYTRSAELSLGLHEMKSYQVSDDLPQWLPLIEWLDLPTARTTPPGPMPGPLMFNSAS
jgi:chromosome partitioning protein